MPAPGQWHLGDPLELTEEDKRARAQLMARIARDTDPGLVRRFVRWENSNLTPRNVLDGLPLASRPQKTHFDSLADWYAGYLGVRGEYEAPFELRQDLKQQVPQAVLRDIYRPTKQHPFEQARHELDLDPGGARAMAEAREARDLLRREKLPTVDPGSFAIAEEQARRRRFLATPWAPFRPDSEPRVYTDQDHVRVIEVDEDGNPLGDDAEAAGGVEGEGEGGDAAAAAYAAFASVADGIGD